MVNKDAPDLSGASFFLFYNWFINLFNVDNVICRSEGNFFVYDKMLQVTTSPIMKKIQDKTFLANSQYQTGDNLKNRWNLYDFAVPKVDLQQIAIDKLKLSGCENILDVGCGSGDLLSAIKSRGHQGRLVGVDISSSIFSAKNIEFRKASADQLPFPDNSFDIIFSFFMFYHLSDKQKALKEWGRILKPNGTLVIATSSLKNKLKHKSFKKKIAKALDAEVTTAFSDSFNLENAAEQLSPLFSISSDYIYEGEIQLKDPSAELRSMSSIRDTFSPQPTESAWNNAIGEIRDLIQEEISNQGYYSDNVKRGFFITKNLKQNLA